MVRPRIRIFCLTVMLAAFGVANPAGAVNLWTTTSTTGGTANVTTGGLTITATGCSARIGGALSACNVLNLQLLVTTVAGGEAEVEIIGAGGGPIFSTALTVNGHAEKAGADDLTLTLSVTSSTKTVSNVGAIMTGSDTTAGAAHADLADISMSENPSGKTSSGTTASGAISGLNLGLLPSGVYSGSVEARTNMTTSSGQVVGVSSFTTTKDITLSPPSDGSTLVLSSVSQLFREVPEPAPFAVLAVGLGGLAFVRRRLNLKPRATGTSR